jgi:UDPglucose 6-dehydrogenase
MHIAVVGAGYVGMVQAICLCDLGHSVVLIENDRDRHRMLEVQNLSPVIEPGVNEGLRRYRDSLLTVSSRLDDVSGCSIVFLCVGTPARRDGLLDVSQLETAVQQIADLLALGTSERSLSLVVKSTVPVGTCRRLRDRILAAGVDSSRFAVIDNPEFLREGSGIADFKNPDRIIIGVDPATHDGPQALIELYSSSFNRVAVMSWESAELVKLASNAFLASKISFANMIADLCEQVGADATDVLNAVGADKRIGVQFLKPGIGWGGGCLPKDLDTLIHELRLNDVPTDLLDGVRVVNRERPNKFVQTVKATLGTLKGKRIAIWGLSYKGGTGDLRESPALLVVNSLLSAGADVCAYDDPMPLMANVANLKLASDGIDALRGAEALCILNDSPLFSKLLWSPACKEAMRSTFVFDGRNLYNPHEIASFGYTYVGVGSRNGLPSVTAQKAESSSATGEAGGRRVHDVVGGDGRGLVEWRATGEA